MNTLIIFILILSLLVLVHEGGHFFAARYFNMKVYEFGIGFPPRAVGFYTDPETGKRQWVWGKGASKLKETVSGDEKENEEEFPATVYSINWLPLGGFVRIKGESGDKRDEEDSFAHKAAWKRVVVLSAGVIMNFILAAVLLGVGFMIGLPASGDVAKDPNAIVLQEPQPTIQQVQADSPADKAGFKMGDEVLSINGQKFTDSEELVGFIQENSDKELNIQIERGEEMMTLSATPDLLKEGDKEKKLGVRMQDAAVVKYPWYIAIYKGFMAAVSGTIAIVYGFYLLAKNLIVGQGMPFEVSGPVGIASVIGQSARLGIHYLLNVTAMISLSLAVLNILPIPALDGGRILFVGLEKIFGKDKTEKYEQAAHTVGFLLLMGLIIVVTYRDIVRVF